MTSAGRDDERIRGGPNADSKTAAVATVIAPSVIVVVLIALAAALLDPERSATPIVSSIGRFYFVAVALLGACLAVAGIASSDTGARSATVPVASAFLVTAATSLVIVERIRPGVILMLVFLAAGIAYSKRRAAQPDQSTWAWLSAGLALALVWIAIAGLTSFRLQGTFALPVTAAIAGAGAVVATRNSGAMSLGLPAVAIIAIAGAELQFALSFILLDPFISATLWMTGLALAFGLTRFVSMKVSG